MEAYGPWWPDSVGRSGPMFIRTGQAWSLCSLRQCTQAGGCWLLFLSRIGSGRREELEGEGTVDSEFTHL